MVEGKRKKEINYSLVELEISLYSHTLLKTRANTRWDTIMIISVRNIVIRSRGPGNNSKEFIS